MNRFAAYWAIALLALSSLAFAQVPASTPWVNVGAADLRDWTGGSQIAAGRETSFRFPDGPKNFYHHGFRLENDGTIDLAQYAGLRFEVELQDDKPVQLSIRVDFVQFGRKEDKTITTPLALAGRGWHTVYLPWSTMPFPQAGSAFLKFGKGVTIAAMGGVNLRDVRIVRAERIAAKCDVRGKPAARGETAAYDVDITNTTDQPQAAVMSFVKFGWQVMEPTVEPTTLDLAPGETKRCLVKVLVSDRVPSGGHEQQTLQVIANGETSKAAVVTFTTTSQVPHPYVLHTPARWDVVKANVQKYDWAKKGAAGYIAQANEWKVPMVAVAPNNDPNDNHGPFVFSTSVEPGVLASAYAYELTGDQKYAAKVATLLLRLSDPHIGYPATLRACNQNMVQEGGFFQHMAMAYDIVHDTISPADREQIDTTFRMLMETLGRENLNGSINNWNLAEVTGGFYCALVLQDLERAERFFSGPCGVREQLAKGTLDDGWWYECAIGYNMWCASEFTQAALAYQPFGVDLLHDWVPASYSPLALLSTHLNGGNSIETPELPGKPFGMDASIFGPNNRPYRQISDLWDSLLPFIDYRGVMFGVNDATEMRVAGNRTEVSGQPFEIAYYAFRDPKYATLIKLGGGERDLLYAVPDLPEKAPESYTASAHADNVGVAMLRSQTPDRPIREQIQAVLHFGTHGWAHGHYDRTGLLSLMRYGRSFYNPEMLWHGYGNFLYKFYVQESVSKNMVVVDQKEQAASPGVLRLFHTGQAMQATAVDTTTRWSYPPYGGMVYDSSNVTSFEEKTWQEGRFVPIPATQPTYGILTDFTEPILQRRLMVVTDDYVLLADYVRGTREHTFDNLLQIKGFKGFAGDLKPLRHDSQWSTDPLSSAQFVTDANWYSADSPMVAKFETIFGPGGDDMGFRPGTQEPGVLKLDVHALWPARQEAMVAQVPEEMAVDKRLFWTVRGDGKTLAEGKFGAWILGKGAIDVSLDGVKSLDLETRIEHGRKPSIFWANAVVVVKDGKEMPLASLPSKTDNVLPAAASLDYAGGPLKIAGDPVSNCLPGEPKDPKRVATIHVDLSSVGAIRLEAVVGADFPTGDESQRRKTLAFRTHGTSARFLTLIEPYENQNVIQRAAATGDDALRVELKDGRVQEITLQNLTGDGSDVGVMLTESRDGKTVRTEIAKP